MTEIRTQHVTGPVVGPGQHERPTLFRFWDRCWILESSFSDTLADVMADEDGH